MKTYQVPKRNTNTRAFFYFLITVFLSIMASCSKDFEGIHPEEIGVRITFIAPNEIPERLSTKFNIRPTYGTMSTDRGTYRFDITDSFDRGFSTIVQLHEGMHKVNDISLYNAIDENVMYMEEKKEDTSKGSGVVSWIGGTWDFKGSDTGHIMQVFYR